MKDKFIPIDCGFLDRIQYWCQVKEHCIIVFTQGNFPRPIQREGIINDVITKNKEEFIILDDGEMIRLDRIISINDYDLPKNPCRIG